MKPYNPSDIPIWNLFEKFSSPEHRAAFKKFAGTYHINTLHDLQRWHYDDLARHELAAPVIDELAHIARQWYEVCLGKSLDAPITDLVSKITDPVIRAEISQYIGRAGISKTGEFAALRDEQLRRGGILPKSILEVDKILRVEYKSKVGHESYIDPPKRPSEPQQVHEYTVEDKGEYLLVNGTVIVAAKSGKKLINKEDLLSLYTNHSSRNMEIDAIAASLHINAGTVVNYLRCVDAWIAATRASKDARTDNGDMSNLGGKVKKTFGIDDIPGGPPMGLLEARPGLEGLVI